MKPHLKRRVIRKIVAALLDSDLSASEIREIGKSVASDASFQRDLGDLLGKLDIVLGHAEKRTRSQDLEHLSEAQRDWLLSVLSLVQQKRKSKREIIELLGLLRPGVGDSLDAGLTMRDLLSAFVRTASASDLHNVKRVLQVDLDDPYLKGIMRRNDKEST